MLGRKGEVRHLEDDNQLGGMMETWQNVAQFLALGQLLSALKMKMKRMGLPRSCRNAGLLEYRNGRLVSILQEPFDSERSARGVLENSFSTFDSCLILL